MTSICVQTENVFYIPFLVLLHSHLQERLHSGSNYFTCWCSCSWITADHLWLEATGPAAKPSLAEGGSPAVSQGSHSLGWPLSHQWSKEHQKVICEVTAIKHTDPDNSRACEWAKVKTLGREDKVKVNGSGKFCFINVGNCEQSVCCGAWKCPKSWVVLFLRKTERCCSVELSQRTLNSTCACKLLLTKVSRHSTTNPLTCKGLALLLQLMSLNTTRSSVITLQKLMRLSLTVLKERRVSFRSLSSFSFIKKK